MTLVVSITLVLAICYVVLHKEDLSNLNKDRLNMGPPDGHYGPQPNKGKHRLPELTNLDVGLHWLFALFTNHALYVKPEPVTFQIPTRPKHPRNRIEAVHNALDDGAIDFDGGQGVDRAEDKAEEKDFDNYEAAAAGAKESNGADEVTDDKAITFTGPTNSRQKAVVEAFQYAWTNYRRFAWGNDHLRPISKTGQNWFGLGLTIVDSLDTMLIMNLLVSCIKNSTVS